MATSDHEEIIQRPFPTAPLRRRRSRLGEPTVRIELVVIDGNGLLGKELLRRQASAVQDALQWFADTMVRRPPTRQRASTPGRDRARSHVGPPRATSRAARTGIQSPPGRVSAGQILSRMLCLPCRGHF